MQGPAPRAVPSISANQVIENSPIEKDSRILIGERLDMSWQHGLTAQKASHTGAVKICFALECHVPGDCSVLSQCLTRRLKCSNPKLK